MIKIKNIDQKLSDIDFVKIEENEFRCTYERYDFRYHYTQVVDILYKENGEHILQSYDKDITNSESTCVGLTAYEMELFLKKMKKLGLYSKKI